MAVSRLTDRHDGKRASPHPRGGTARLYPRPPRAETGGAGTIFSLSKGPNRVRVARGGEHGNEG